MKPLLLFFLLLLTAYHAYPQSDGIRQKNFNIKKNLAIEGYDPVSYFEGKPKKGEESILFVYKGITYLFANTTNRDKFKNTPLKYEPAYGGWCAYAMGDSGDKVKVDPETYKIIGNKLYLITSGPTTRLKAGTKTKRHFNKRPTRTGKKSSPETVHRTCFVYSLIFILLLISI